MNDDKLEEILDAIEALKAKVMAAVSGEEEDSEEDDPMQMSNRDTQDPEAHPLAKTEYTTGEAEKKSKRKMGLMLAFLKEKKK